MNIITPNFIIEEISEVSKLNSDYQKESCQQTDYKDILDKVEKALFKWNDNIYYSIETNEYLNNFEEININFYTSKDLIISIMIYQELLCETTKIKYVKKIEAKYSIIDIYNLINGLLESKDQIDQTELILFSASLFDNLKSEYSLNLCKITNKIPSIISMVFYNEIQEQMKSLGLKTKLTIDNLQEINLLRSVEEKFL